MTALRIDTFPIAGVKLVVPSIHSDARGYLSETYSAKTFAEAGIAAAFVQDNHSLSVENGTIRGMHFQAEPFAQGKLVRVVRGAILDVAVDIRHGSPTFGKHVAVVLSAANRSQLWIPKGFAHGFCTLERDTEVFYKVTNHYAAECDHGLAWDDPSIRIGWPVPTQAAILSEKDKRHPTLAALPTYFSYESSVA